MKGADAMLIQRRIVAVVLVYLTLGLASLSAAEDKSSQGSPELGKNMADMYQKMADCLRTGKYPEDCQRAVAKDCPVLAKTGQCPLQEGTGHMRGRGMRPEGMGPMTGPHEMR
jgi:hypothetical protein